MSFFNQSEKAECYFLTSKVFYILITLPKPSSSQTIFLIFTSFNCFKKWQKEHSLKLLRKSLANWAT